jgi:predicted DNA-binding transcriptional regulator AlpA
MMRNAQYRWKSLNLRGVSFRRSRVKTKPKSKSATSPTKALSSQSSGLRGWPAIAQFLGMPNSTVHRWAKDGMPVRREGRNVVASPEELNQWLQRTSGEPVGVHVVSPGSDLLKDLRASLAVQKSSKNSASQPKNESRSSRGTKALKTKASRKS